MASTLPENEAKAVAAGALEAAVDAMRMHAGARDVQEAGSRLLAALTWDRGEFRNRANAAGAREALASALALFSFDEGVCQWATAAQKARQRQLPGRASLFCRHRVARWLACPWLPGLLLECVVVAAKRTAALLPAQKLSGR